MGEAVDNPVQALECFRGYLQCLAETGLRGRFLRRFDAADIVQQTLAEACKGMTDFRGGTPEQMAAWLRKILANNLSNAVRDNCRACRDPRSEVSLEEPSEQLESWLADDRSSPFGRVCRSEDLLRLTEALARLPEPQREALVMRHCHGWPLAEIGRQLDRTEAAVAGLLHRGLDRLRCLLGGD